MVRRISGSAPLSRSTPNSSAALIVTPPDVCTYTESERRDKKSNNPSNTADSSLGRINHNLAWPLNSCLVPGERDIGTEDNLSTPRPHHFRDIYARSVCQTFMTRVTRKINAFGSLAPDILERYLVVVIFFHAQLPISFTLSRSNI